MEHTQRDATHQAPVWSNKANFIIAAPLDEQGWAEQLWARQVDDRRFEICCIPFFAYDVALGDVVATDEKYEITSVVEPSGRFVFRVWFGESFYSRAEVSDEIEDRGALIEWSSPNLLAVDAKDENDAKVIAHYLAEQQNKGRLTYETGRSADDQRAPSHP